MTLNNPQEQVVLEALAAVKLPPGLTWQAEWSSPGPTRGGLERCAVVRLLNHQEECGRVLLDAETLSRQAITIASVRALRDRVLPVEEDTLPWPADWPHGSSRFA